ncbi:hypothetical protein EYF80_039074 [Liparis tanakae]|uniref:Uncharacterized protein n=1 Tax=Liparis tanakae TaxID=230148 RepID=A0A4Z2GCW1_9TELE|nr:hypothetical protein EYF80_039074 [Liparis tanakae]
MHLVQRAPGHEEEAAEGDGGEFEIVFLSNGKKKKKVPQPDGGLFNVLLVKTNKTFCCLNQIDAQQLITALYTLQHMAEQIPFLLL